MAEDVRVGDWEDDDDSEDDADFVPVVGGVFGRF